MVDCCMSIQMADNPGAPSLFHGLAVTDTVTDAVTIGESSSRPIIVDPDVLLKIAAMIQRLDAKVEVLSSKMDAFTEKEHASGLIPTDFASEECNRVSETLQAVPALRSLRREQTPKLSLQSWRDKPCLSGLRIILVRFVHHNNFEYTMAVVTVVVCLNVGLALSAELRGEDALVYDVIQKLTLCIYVIEMSLRIVVDGWSCFSNPWVRFDAFLVVSGLLSTGALQLTPHGLRDDLDVLQNIMLLRVLRLLRVARVFRLLPIFSTLWTLVRGLLCSASTILSTLVLLIFVDYFFACVGIEVITKNETLLANDAMIDIIDNNFSDIPQTMLTLVQFVTLDSIASLYTPLIYECPWLALYFLPVIVVLSVSVMNLVTAVLVDTAMRLSTQDQEMSQLALEKNIRALEPQVRAMFQEVDEDKSGLLNPEEILKCYEMLPKTLSDCIPRDSLSEFFGILDVDGSGEIDEDEFFEGMLTMALSDVPIQTTQMLKLLRHVKSDVEFVRRALGVVQRAPRA